VREGKLRKNEASELVRTRPSRAFVGQRMGSG
jgi:hypothetical protein